MAKKISKINLKKQRIRSTIFSGISISRQELIRQTGFSGRTVNNYTSELKRHRLIREEIAVGQRGRPGIIYRSNSERIIFISVSLITCKLCFAVIDINSYLLYSNVIILPERTPSTDVIRLSLEELQNIRNRFPDMAVAAIGCNLNSYRQDSQRSLKFRELVSVLRRLYDIHVELMEDSELIFRRLYKSLLLKGNAGLFVPGDNICTYVITDGELRDDLDGYFRDFKHRQIDRASSEICCICGRRGCIESLLTYDSTKRRYLKLTGKGDPGSLYNLIYNNILIQSQAGAPDACRIIKENGIYIARAVAVMKKELHLDHILLCNSTHLLYRSLLAEYEKLTGDTTPLLNFSYLTVSDTVYTAAELMRLKILNL